MAHVTLLGTGASAGVPMIGCTCAVCTSPLSRNKRTRTSIVLEAEGTTVLIDTSPDLRTQALSCNLTHVDAVIFTHAHADHTHGIDELRSFNYLSGRSLPTYGDEETLATLKERFAYAFDAPPSHVWVRPSLIPHVVTPNVPISIGPLTIIPFAQEHGKTLSLGIRYKRFAYSTDVSGFPEASHPFLEDLDLWVLDCLRYDATPTHASLPQSLGWVKQFRPARTVLTHMSHALDYQRLCLELPKGVEPGYDGMRIEIF